MSHATNSVDASPAPTTDGEEQDIDICPTCDFECTCLPQSTFAVSGSSHTSPLLGSLHASFASVASSASSSNGPLLSHSADTGPLKIKLKVPAHLIARTRTTRSRALGPRPIKRVTKLDGDDDNDGTEWRFPTFVSASGLSSFGSDDDDISESDSSAKREENDYFCNKARVRRELLGDDDPVHRQHYHPPHNKWIIRSRRKSVELTKVEMDVDSDDGYATEDEEGQEDDDDGDDDVEDTDGRSVPYSATATAATAAKVGWSDDEESSFDADLFFANLSSSEDGDADTDVGKTKVGDGYATSGTEDTSTARANAHTDFEVTQGWDGQLMFTSGLRATRGFLDMEFEADAVRVLFESSSSASVVMSQESDADHVMHTSSECGADCEHNDDEEGGDEDEGAGGDDDAGETTEEELVGPDGLPTPRAMRLVKLPASVSAINPLSTMGLGPDADLKNGARPTWLRRHHHRDCPRRRPLDRYHRQQRPRRRADSAPVNRRALVGGDICSCDVEAEEEEADYGGRSPAKSKTGVPLMGKFERVGESGHGSQRSAIIDGSSNEIPSPYPRCKRRMRSRMSSFSGWSSRGRAFSRPPSSLPLCGSNQPSSRETTGQDDVSMCMSPIDFEEVEPTIAPAMGLDDVLEASFFQDSDPSSEMEIAILGETAACVDNGKNTGSETREDKDSVATTGSTTKRLLEGLNRWDVIPVGAFRQTRDIAAAAAAAARLSSSSAAASASCSTTNSTTGAVAVWSGTRQDVYPLEHVMLAGASTTGWRSAEESVVVASTIPSSRPVSSKEDDRSAMRRFLESPVLLPRDGDRTPTSMGTGSASVVMVTEEGDASESMPTTKESPKTRRESRREKKLRRKNLGAVVPPHRQHPQKHASSSQHQQQLPVHHQHQHHPNMKTRSSGAVQRTGFFVGGAMSGVPPLSL